MNDKIIDNLQEIALQEKGFSLICEVYRRYISDNKNVFSMDEIDAMEYTLSSINMSYSKQLKQITDELK